MQAIDRLTQTNAWET